MSEFEVALAENGVVIPDIVKPLAAYVPGIQCGFYVYVSGQLPISNGILTHKGKLGDNISPEDACDAARLCALNCLGVVKSMVGDLEKVEQIIKVTGTEHPAVVNGASRLFCEVFGDKGLHSRCAVGVASLPLGACCKVDLIAKIKQKFKP